MTPVFRSRTGPAVILASYVALPVLGFLWWGLPAALVGLGIAYGVGRLYPRWYAELSWDEVHEAVRRLHEAKPERSGIDLLVGQRRVSLVRYTPGDVARLGIMLPLADWGDLLTPEAQDAFGENGAGVWYRGGVGARNSFFARATTEGDAVEECLRMLRFALKLADARLEADVYVHLWWISIGQ